MQTNERKSKSCQIVAFVGSAWLSLLDHIDTFPNSLLLVLDVPSELERLQFLQYRKQRAILLPLGNEQTTETLIGQYGSNARNNALKYIANTQSKDGLAQLPAAGGCAIEQLMSHPDTLRILSESVPELIADSGGILEFIELLIISGTGGGTSSEGAPVFARGYSRILADTTGLSIRVNAHLLGSVTFSGSAFPRTQINTACSMARWIEFAQNTQDPRISVTLFPTELVPARTDRERRDSLICQQHTAFTCLDVQRKIDQERSNLAANGPFGNIILPTTTHFDSIPEDQIETDIARQYLPLVQDVLDCPPAYGRVLGVDLLHAESKLPTPEQVWESLLSLDDLESIRDFLDSLFSAAEAEATVELSNASRIFLPSIGELLSEPVNSPQLAKERLGLALAVADKLRLLQLDLAEELEEFRVQVESCQNSVARALYRVQGRAYFNLFSQTRLENRLEEALGECIEVMQARHEVETELTYVSRALANVEQAIETQIERFSRLAGKLERSSHFSDAVSPHPHVNARPLEQTLSLLMHAVEQSQDAPGFTDILVRCVGETTLHGIARSVRAEDVSIESIVSASIAARFADASPHWGGVPRKDRPMCFVVYPPTANHIQKMLIQQHAAQKDLSKVSFADQTAPSRAVSKIELRNCNDLMDIFVPPYRFALGKAMESPIAPLFLDDVGLLEKIGINVNSKSSN